MSILGWIVIGGLAGWLASRIAGTYERQGCFLDIVVGITGAFVGGAIMNLVGGVGITGFNVYSFLVATLGAVVFLSILKLFH
jgi:uncharacterized membrane protein YeaQ/YmgE (transglycosylase-associated protein family)